MTMHRLPTKLSHFFKIFCLRVIIGIFIGFSGIAESIFSTDLRVAHGIVYSRYENIDTADAEAVTPVHQTAFYFLDTRLQNMGIPRWMIRANVYGRYEVTKSEFRPNLRNLYIQNRKPVANHWLFSAGRIRSPYIIPMFRLDGASIAYTPSVKKKWQVGVVAGKRPQELSAFRNYSYKPYVVGTFFELRGKRQDQLRLMYNAGLDLENTDTTIDHKAQLQGIKSYKLFGKDSFFRVGALYSSLFNIIDYAYVEDGIYWNKATTHSLSYMKSQTVFVDANKNKEEIHFQEAVYRIHYTPRRSLWYLAANAGYSNSLEQDGYVAQFRIHRKETFMKTGTISLTSTVRKRGYYDQKMGRLGYNISSLFFVSLFVAGGYESVTYRDTTTNAYIAEIEIGSTLASSIDFSLSVEGRFIDAGSIDIQSTVSLMHFFGHRFSKKEKREIAPEISSSTELENKKEVTQ